MTELAGRTAVVTGASRGLGLKIALRYLEAGAKVLAVARDGSSLTSAFAGIRPDQRRHLATLSCDVGDDDAAERIVKHCADRFGSLDTVVLNAAIQGPIGPVWENDPIEWADTLRINLLAPARLAARAVPLMRAQNRGALIFLSGGGATGPRPRFSAYASAKAGLVRFAETLAHELDGTSIAVNVIAPGAMPTQMLQEVLDSGEKAGGSELEAARRAFASGDSAASRAVDLAVFLASDASSGITGRLISAIWDRWEDWPAHLEELNASDVYTLRRITGRDRGKDWGDR